MILKIFYIILGFLAHQTRIIIDGFPNMFSVGWKELVSYILGSLCIHELFPKLSRKYGLTKEQSLTAKHAHITTLVLFGIGVALGWVFDGYLNSINTSISSICNTCKSRLLSRNINDNIKYT